MHLQQHWENVYHTTDSSSVSWYSPHLETSLQLVRQLVPALDTAILDVGSGASILPDDLLAAGYGNLTLLDISQQALDIVQQRLGSSAQYINWLVGNVLDVALPAGHYGLWHDRAVFHFLTSRQDRQRYVQQALHAIKPGGYIIMATFGMKGPEQCSGLDVMRYDADSLYGEFGSAFQPLGSLTTGHQTPAGKVQEFLYCYCRVGG